MNQIAFEARLGGDGECFCFFVNTSTYIFLVGRERYEQELQYLKDAAQEMNTQYQEPTEWMVYPSDMLEYKPNTQYIVSFGITEKDKLK
jgi:hypothetical protein